MISNDTNSIGDDNGLLFLDIVLCIEFEFMDQIRVKAESNINYVRLVSRNANGILRV